MGIAFEFQAMPTLQEQENDHGKKGSNQSITASEAITSRERRRLHPLCLLKAPEAYPEAKHHRKREHRGSWHRQRGC